MTHQIVIKCDRCQQEVSGIVGEINDRRYYTGGFYDVSEGRWSEFARNEERIVCDYCMFADPKYREMYSLP
jgi:hypothetical protein